MRFLCLASLALFAPSTLFAQDTVTDTDGEAEDREVSPADIVVVATRLAGQVDTDIPPVLTLDEAEISTYGAGSIAELLDALGPQTGSGRGRGGGRPIILLNGQRISSFREMRAIPPEAIRRMEVLPEEVALKFGYPPNERVVNFILKANFASSQVAGEYNVPTRGGYLYTELEGGTLRIDGPKRMNLEAKIVSTSLLTEAERGIVQDPEELLDLPVGTDPGEYRSLAPEKQEITLNGTWSNGLGEDGLGGLLSANAAYTRTDTRSLTGLDNLLLAGPEQSLRALERENGTDLFEAGVALNKPLGGWLLTVTGDASYSDSVTRSDLPGGIGAGRDLARSKDATLASLATLAGRPFTMPAGDASLTVKAGYNFNRSDNSDTRTVADSTVLKRGDLSAGANLSLPLTSRKNDVLAGVGDLSANASIGVNRLSDFGTLSDWSAGLIWNPTEKLTIQASYIANEAAPSLSQLGAPEIVTFNVPIYDFARGETAIVTLTTGGNPALRAEKQRDWKLSVNWDLPVLRRSNLLVEYFRNRSDNVTNGFPLLTPAIEAAFPGRAIRDANGRLIAIDRRPVTFARVSSSQLRWGLNLSGSLSKQEEPSGESTRGAGGRGGRTGADAPPRMPFGRGGPPGGRWNLSVYHTVSFSDRVTIAEGGPVLDQLAGDALSAGGVPRHRVSFEGGVFKNGYGLRLRGSWRAPATVSSNGAPGTSDLRFGSIFNVYARIFINLDQREGLIERVPLLKGTNIAFEFDNLFDSRQKVTDETGQIPLAYQRAYREPQGRVIGIDVRKRF